MSLKKELGKKFVSAIGLSKPTAISLLDEFNLSKARLRSLSPKQYAKIRKLKKTSELRLNIGCGKTQYVGWIGLDMFPGETTDIVLDLRRKLPFSDQSVAYCYSEHFAEHLYPEEFIVHLKEVHRVLRDGGIYRIVVPNARRFFQKYLDEDDGYFETAFPWANSNFEAVYCMCNWHGIHRSIFDVDFIKKRSFEVGFSTCYEVNATESSIKGFSIPVKNKQRELESLYVEIVK